MVIHCNDGVTETDFIINLPNYSEIWYHPNGISNVLFLSRVKEKHWVAFSINTDNEYVLHNKGGYKIRFIQSQCGLYYLQMG